jgi:hypothetical protein
MGTVKVCTSSSTSVNWDQGKGKGVSAIFLQAGQGRAWAEHWLQAPDGRGHGGCLRSTQQLLLRHHTCWTLLSASTAL